MKTALVIEDNLDIRENTAEILELAGFNVVAVVNGREGIHTAVSTIPDLILCDITMPEVTGYEVITELKKNPQTANIPFIYISARAENKDVNFAMNMGAQGYIKKPFDAGELIAVIEQVLCR